jgi:transketolase
MAATRQSSGAPSAAPAAGEQDLARLSINTIRGLAMDAVQKANAGHPGTAMALAPLGYVLLRRMLEVNPADTAWPDRDRFVLSAGHACVLQYSLLHLCGWDLSLDDLKQFRQWGSRTPGHPERGHTRASRSGRSRAGVRQRGRQRSPSAGDRFKPGRELLDHRHLLDGDMMEGISQGAASAGLSSGG